jgi:GH25 family lysozyme M1 (1,4-beta-N-acetylmuramidase)
VRQTSRRLAKSVVAALSLALIASLVPLVGLVPNAPGPLGAEPAEAQSWGVTGVDVASWQHPNGAAIDWAAVRGAGHRFAFVKATEGAWSAGGGRYTNPWFAQDWVGAGAAGLYRGAYHYAQPTADPADAVGDARHFVAATGLMNGALDLPPVLDVEEHKGLNRSQMVAWISAWLNETERLTGRQPLIYTGPWFWNTYVGSTAFTGYRLWIASYTTASGPGALPGGWPTWTIWQWTSDGIVPGISGRTDLNRFCCDLATLAALTAGGGAQVAGNPFGYVDSVTRVAGAIDVVGWAIDPDTTAAVTVHAYVDGRWGGSHTANVPRPDIGVGYPQYGPNHGVAVRIPVALGEREVCLYAINVGSGTTNPKLGCRTFPGSLPPIGNYEQALLAPGGARLIGWLADEDSPGSVNLRVRVNGAVVATGTANLTRTDVGSVYPDFGNQRGFVLDVPLTTPGPVSLCVEGIDGTTGDPVSAGCRTVTVPASPLVGALQDVTAGDGSLQVGGWVFNWTTAGAVELWVTDNGTRIATLTADASRPEVGTAFPAFGSNRGFASTWPAVRGPHTLCVGSGPTTLGCRTVTVATGDFADVAPGTWFSAPTRWVGDREITTGLPQPWLFSPQVGLDRAQAVTFLWRYMGKPSAATTCGWVDVPATAWYAQAACWAESAGVSTGFGGSDRFAPSATLTRAQWAAMQWRTAGSKPATVANPFTDVADGTWVAEAALWMVEHQITTGVGQPDRFAPTDPVSRAEAATFLWRLAGSPAAWATTQPASATR